jgi:N-carbamoyl-L-amino-acid hydrolase
MPRVLRHDAVFAVADLVVEMDALWREIEEDEGGDLVLTFGQFSTDAATHSVTSVPGHVTFSFDARSHSQEILDRVERELLAKATAIGRRRGAIFEFAPITGDPPIAMDRRLQTQLLEGCHRLSIPAASLASGAGHDAGDFAAAGIPTAMIFVRNDNGSHNPQESMDIGDFAAGVRLLTWFVGNFDSRQP